MTEPTGEHSLDELARGLASGSLSRGKALRLIGGALLGAALAAVPGVARADDRCSSYSATWAPHPSRMVEVWGARNDHPAPGRSE